MPPTTTTTTTSVHTITLRHSAQSASSAVIDWSYSINSSTGPWTVLASSISMSTCNATDTIGTVNITNGSSLYFAAHNGTTNYSFAAVDGVQNCSTPSFVYCGKSAPFGHVISGTQTVSAVIQILSSNPISCPVTTLPPTTLPPTTTTLPPHSYSIYTNLTSGSNGIKIYYKINSGSWTLIGNYSPASFSICPGSSTLITTLSIPYGSNVSVAIRNSSFDTDITFGESPINCNSSTGFFGQSSFYTRTNVISDVSDYFTAQI